MSKRDWHYILFLFLSHHPPARIHRTIRLNVGGKRIHLCARCTGRYSALVGLFAAYFLGYMLPLDFFLPLIATLPLPGIADWLSQSCRLRESKNAIRVSTGSLLGIAEGLLLLLLINGQLLTFAIGAATIGAYAFGIYLLAAKTKYLKAYLDDVQQGK